MLALKHHLVKTTLTIVCIGLSVLGCYAVPDVLSKRQTLWDIVDKRCETSRDAAGACLVVNRQAGYVVLRDLHGPVQTLIIPTAKITGIEDAQLLQHNTKNYFNDAWLNRAILDQQHKKHIEPRYLSFSVNAAYGRTQDQLHIHSSCLKSSVYEQLQRDRHLIGKQWAVLPNNVLGHRYLAKKITLSNLATIQPFQELSAYIQQQKAGQMAEYGLAMVSAQDDEILLLATKLDVEDANFGSIEEVQDTFCAVTQ